MADRRYINPDFHLEEEPLRAEFERMRATPVALRRPVVILGGWHAPGVANWSLASKLIPATSGKAGDFLSITYAARLSLASAARAAFHAMQERGLLEQELDLIGISMGGILARALAVNLFSLGEIKARRVLTVASPHRGAKIARVVIPDAAAWDMRPGSRFLTELNKREPAHELHCYAALRDWWIGARNTAPPGLHPYWVDIHPGLGRLCTHFAINHEKRVIADIARRLRAEEPIAQRPSEPPID
jgi:Predicted acetyltransferases and hydrolases with the alpha/beta hydrolase fold